MTGSGSARTGTSAGVDGAAVWAAATAGVSTAITSAARIALRYQEVRRDPRPADAPLCATQPTQDNGPRDGDRDEATI